MNWQPIETAPEETDVFCFWRGLGGPNVDGRNYGVAMFSDGMWRDPEDPEIEFVEPTHWMPLPEPPK